MIIWQVGQWAITDKKKIKKDNDMIGALKESISNKNESQLTPITLLW